MPNVLTPYISFNYKRWICSFLLWGWNDSKMIASSVCLQWKCCNIHTIYHYVQSPEDNQWIGVFVFLQNIQVMAKYYTRVQMKRMAQLLDLTEAVSRKSGPEDIGDLFNITNIFPNIEIHIIKITFLSVHWEFLFCQDCISMPPPR